MYDKISLARSIAIAGACCVFAILGPSRAFSAEPFESVLSSSNFSQVGEAVGDPATSPADAGQPNKLGLIESPIRPNKILPGAEVDEAVSSDENREDEEKNDVNDITQLSKKIADFDDEMNDFEKSLEKVEKLAGNKSLVVSGSSNSTMKISGRIHLDAWGFDTDDDPAISQFNGGFDPQNRLGFRRLRFGVAGKIKDNMVYKIEMEFANGNDVEFRDAYMGWTDLPFLQEVLLGNQKRPFGLDHLNSSRYNVFIERPFVIEAFNEDARRLGLQSYGVSDDLAWNWRYGVFNQRNVQDEGNYLGDHLQLQLAGRLANTFWYDDTSNGRGYGHWAISGSHADVSTNARLDANNPTIGGTEARFARGPKRGPRARAGLIPVALRGPTTTT